MSEVAIEQHFPPTEVVMNKNKNEREVLEKITTTKVDRNVAETSSNDDDVESFAPDVVELMSDEIKDGVFLEQVKTVISILREELGDKHKTPMKHFCAYICWRLETREGIAYNPTNTKQKVNEIANLKAYRHWFLKKVGLPQNIYDLMIKGGYGKHWRSYVQDTLAEATTLKIINTFQMFPTWLAKSEDRKKSKKDDSTHSGGGDSRNES